jgi:hypothetical protein
MKVIKVTTGTAENETTKVEVIAPGGDGSPDTCESCTDLAPGQSVLLNAEGDVTVGETETTE